MNRIVVTVVAIGVAAAAGFFAQRHFNPAPPGDGAASTADAPALPEPEPAAPPRKKVPDTLPDFELADREGAKRKISEWAGRPVMVNFWATWCAPCRREIPLLNQVREQRKSQKLEIIGVAVDFRDDVLKYASEFHIAYPLLIGEEDGLAAVNAMGMEPNFPFTAFADSKQRIVALKVGELHQEDIDLILDRVAVVDVGKLDLPAAREQISEGLKQIAAAKATKEAAEAAESPKLPAG